MTLHGDERGLKGLGTVLAMVAVLAAVAVPLMTKLRSEVDAVSAIAARRVAAIEEVMPDEVRVAGVRLERSEDGATCRWTASSSGTVFGVWELGARSVHGSFDAAPDVCPTAADVAIRGFGRALDGP
jgi:hypothetical protein